MGNKIQRGVKRTRRVLLIDEVVEEIGIGAGGWTTVLVGIATLVNYLGWLGWDQTKYRGSDGYLHGPYEPWQFARVVLGLAVIAAVAGWRHHPWEAVVSATVVMMLCVAVDGAMDPNADGLFIIDAFVAAGHTFSIVGLAALIADGSAGGKSPGQATPGWHRRPWVWIVMTVMLVVNLLYWL